MPKELAEIEYVKSLYMKSITGFENLHVMTSARKKLMVEMKKKPKTHTLLTECPILVLGFQNLKPGTLVLVLGFGQ